VDPEALEYEPRLEDGQECPPTYLAEYSCDDEPRARFVAVQKPAAGRPVHLECFARQPSATPGGTCDRFRSDGASDDVRELIAALQAACGSGACNPTCLRLWRPLWLGCLEEQWHCMKAIATGPVQALFAIVERTRAACQTPAPEWSLGNLCET
jgi:hypothetical protein